MFDTLWSDLRYGIRSLLRTPTFSAAVLVTLALGIGANTAIFSLVNAVMLRTLPVAAPDDLVFIGYRNPSADDPGVNLLSNPAWLHRIREETTLFTGVAAYNLRDFKVASATGVDQVSGQYASGNYHALVGVPMALGRGFSNEPEFTTGAEPVAVISDSYWQRRFGGSPDVIGTRLVVGGQAATIVGVTAPGFEGLQPGRSVEITLPLSVRVREEPDWESSLDSWTGMPLIARLRPGVTAAAAEPIVDAAYREHMSTPGIRFGRARDGRFLLEAAVVPAAKGADRLRRDYEPALRALVAIVGIVLLIACVNVANLFLARGTARADELAMRLAIGASRRRLVRQLLTEAVLVAVGGGLVGFVAASWATRYVGTVLGESQRPIALDVQPDIRVFAFTLALAGATALLFGLAPALRSTRMSVPGRATPPTATPPTRSLGRMTLVSAQLALCVVLVFGAALLVRTLRNLEQVDQRFSTDAVLAFAIDANDTGLPVEQLSGLCARAIEALRQPDVLAASCSTMTPLDTAREVRTLGFPPLPPDRVSRDILSNGVTPEYFAAFSIGAVRGRLLTAADTAAAPRVAVINEAAGRHFFAEEDPIGRQIAFGSRPSPDTAITVVGIVGDLRQQLREPPQPMLYQPLEQLPSAPDYLAGAIRTSGDPALVAGRVRAVVRELSPQVAVSWIRTLREQMRAGLVPERLLTTLSVSFGLLALVLAAVGVYGVLGYEVARRTREIGIRMALGARQGKVLRGVLRRVALIVVPAIAVGLFAAIAASRMVEVFLFGITPRDPWALSSTAMVLAGVAFAAGYVPARRAARVDPVIALRTE